MSEVVSDFKDYMKAHPPPPKRQLFERILHVFHPASGLDEALACAALLDVAVKQMSRVELLGQRDSTIELVLALGSDQEPKKPETNVYHTVLRSHSAFWTAFFEHFTRAGEPGKEKLLIMMFMVEFLWNTSLYQRSGENNKVRSVFMYAIVFLSCIQAGEGELYRTWVRAGYFEAVEVSLPYVLTETPDGSSELLCLC